MITDELALSRDGWFRRANELRSLAQDCRGIQGWDSPAGRMLGERLLRCSAAVESLAERAESLGEAYDLHLQVVSVGGRLQI
ncbi:hypothetical protein [Brevibacterium sp. ZH18]|uniref:hypothetical protein n=1 Tax=Brevibacterium sp. ZH18 TaxID=2927784 RepID=UPI001F60C8C7|nr:hypothetical protein [Brevibacterium sp. ZH18]MCI4012083.1 hypothetical protein [Brevibacterium sp. ZH18]